MAVQYPQNLVRMRYRIYRVIRRDFLPSLRLLNLRVILYTKNKTQTYNSVMNIQCHCTLEFIPHAHTCMHNIYIYTPTHTCTGVRAHPNSMDVECLLITSRAGHNTGMAGDTGDEAADDKPGMQNLTR